MKRASLWVLMLCWTAISCGFAAEEAAKLDENIYLGKPVVVENVTVWPVYARKPLENIGDYMTLKQAQEQKTAEIREMGVASGLPAANPNAPAIAAANPPAAPIAEPTVVPVGNAPAVQRAVVQAGNQQNEPVQILQQGELQQQGLQHGLQGDNAQVNQLVIENKGTQPILVLAGTIVKGGKQDRQIGQDFVIMPGKSTPVDSYCVEHGRWTAEREGKATGGKFEAQEQLTSYGVRGSAQYKNNQQAVWDNVSLENAKAGKAPASGTYLATVEETDVDAKARRERLNAAVKTRFKELSSEAEAPVGMAYSVDGKLKEIRAFAHPKIFNLYSETLIGTVSVEGDLAQRQALKDKKEVYNKTADVTQAVTLVQEASKIPEKLNDTQGGNQNGYNKGEKVNACKTYLKSSDGKPAVAPLSINFQTAE